MDVQSLEKIARRSHGKIKEVVLGAVHKYLESYEQRSKKDRNFMFMVMRGTYFIMSKPIKDK